jgi:cbb3-type cytochrome c oxidase subunit III
VRLLAAALTVCFAVIAAGCGTGGVAKGGDQDRGKQLFLNKCGGCHKLAAAGTQGTQGPDLDAAFGPGRSQGFKQSTIEQVVRDQIELPSQLGATGPTMPANLVRGADADAVAAYVAAVAGTGQKANLTTGKGIFGANCGSCHTLAAAGTNGTVGPNLDQLKPSLARAQKQVINGGGGMPAFKGRLTDAQIKMVAQFVAQNAGKK